MDQDSDEHKGPKTMTIKIKNKKEGSRPKPKLDFSHNWARGPMNINTNESISDKMRCL